MGLPSSAQPQDSSSRGWPAQRGRGQLPDAQWLGSEPCPATQAAPGRGARLRTGVGSAHLRRVAAALLESPTRLALAAWGRGQALPTPALARGLSLLHYGLVFVFVLPWS